MIAFGEEELNALIEAIAELPESSLKHELNSLARTAYAFSVDLEDGYEAISLTALALKRLNELEQLLADSSDPQEVVVRTRGLEATEVLQERLEEISS